MSIILDKVNYIYGEGSGFVKHALKDVSLAVDKNEFIGLIGHTGSGKSTLTQIFNGLLRATSGDVYFNGDNIYDKDYDMKKLRSKVGLVFQYPEHQLFETTVFKDVCFGPKNLGLVLILDEPTAGLDPQGRDEILDMVKAMHEQTQMTVILVSHSMEDVAKYVGRILVMNDGRLMYDDVPREVFAHYRELEKIGLAAPQVTYIMHALKERGMDVDTDAITIEEGFKSICKAFGR